MLLICGYCRRLRPLHTDSCPFVGAIRWFDALGSKEPPTSPWVEVPFDTDEKDLKQYGLSEPDIHIFLRLVGMRRSQAPSLPGVTRIIEV